MEPILEVDVKYVLMVFEQVMVDGSRIVVIRLQRHRAAFGGVIPARKDVPAAVDPVVGKGVRIGRRQRRNSQRFVVIAAVHVPLYG